MIELRNFTKAYGDFVAVANLNLKIAAGEMFGFIGPNGAGKSTTIRFLATLLRATAGEGIVNGHSVTQRPDRRAQEHRLHAGQFRRLRRHEGLGVFGLLRRGVRDSQEPAEGGDRRRARAVGPDAQARRFRQRPVARHEAAAVPGQDAGARSAGADPRRAGERPRSRGRGSK